MTAPEDNGTVTTGCPDDYTPEQRLAYIRGQLDMWARLAELHAEHLEKLAATRQNGTK